MPQRNFGYRNRVTPPYGCLPVMSPYAWVIGDRFVGRHDHMPPHVIRTGFDKRSVGAGVLDGPPFTGNAIVRRTGRRGRRPLQRSIETIAFMRATARVAPTHKPTMLHRVIAGRTGSSAPTADQRYPGAGYASTADTPSHHWVAGHMGPALRSV